jgi:ATP-binding cassette, subfamily C, bacterial
LGKPLIEKNKISADIKLQDRSIGIIIYYLRALFQFCGPKAFAALSILISQGLTQGVSILALIPLLQFAGIGETKSDGGTITTFMTRIFRDLGYQPDLVSILFIYIGLVSFYELFNYYQTRLNNAIQQGFTVFMRDRLYSAITRADWLFVTRTRSSDLIHVLTVDIQRIGTGTHFFLMMLGTGTIVIVHLVLAFMISPAMAITVVVCSALLALCLRPLNLKALRLGQTLNKNSRGMFSAITEYLGGMKIAKSFGSEAQYIKRFQDFSHEAAREIIRFSRLQSGAMIFNNIGTVVCISVLFYAAVKIFQIPPVRLFLLIFLFSRILPRVATLQQNYQQILNMLPAYSAVDKMQHDCEQAAEPYEYENPQGIRLTQSIVYQNVSFRYNTSRNVYALKDINIEIPAQRMTAIIGPSGAGKTTMADILIGLLRPTEGCLKVNDMVLNTRHLHNWRYSVGYVPQEPFLFNDTIEANLLYARADASREDIWNALEMAAAASFVKTLPDGLNTVIGDRGIRLSGGERQRIAMARALIRKPELLLLDEATSSLDAKNENQIQDAIERLQGKQTIVVIAHRLSTIRRADLIIVLDRGKVVEQGTWSELSANKKSQFSSMLSADKNKSQPPSDTNLQKSGQATES